jgi:hypothetical protein
MAYSATRAQGAKSLDGRNLLAHQRVLIRGSYKMATTAPSLGDRTMSIGRVFNRALAAVKNNPAVILGLAFVIGALPSLLVTYFFVQAGFYSAASSGLADGSFSPSAFAGTIFISALIGLVIAALVQAALTRATVSASEGRAATFGESLGTGFSMILPVIGLSILFGIGVMFGMILLIVPGVILALMWSVAVPALVIERQGVFAAFGRSADLTKGARWKIFGLVCILVVAYWLLSIVVGIVGLTAYNPADSVAGITTMNLIGSAVLGTISNAVWGTIQPSLYVELRQWKEGTSVEALEQVFA